VIISPLGRYEQEMFQQEWMNVSGATGFAFEKEG
jgi:hypothetical protein